MRKQFVRIIAVGIVGTSLVIGSTFTFAQQKTPATKAKRDVVTKAGLPDDSIFERYQQSISAERLAANLFFLASDSFEGRETTTRGQKLAALYLASQYRQLGLTPFGPKKVEGPMALDAFFQPFTVYRRTAQQSQLELLDGERVEISSSYSAAKQDDLSYFLTGGLTDAAEGNVVFAGYGISDEKLAYDDYAELAAKKLSLNGKWVLVLEDEPMADASTSLLKTGDHKPSRWSTQFINKRSVMWSAGQPKGVLVVTGISPRAAGSFSERAQQAALNAQRVGVLSLTDTSAFPPVFAVSPKFADSLLRTSNQTVDSLRKQINQTLKPVVFDLPQNLKLRGSVIPYEGLKTENVIAYLEGSDPKLKDEVLIVSAHLDHLGLNPALKGDQIFNGAADDGSGTVACLELARAFIKAKQEGNGPRRSILFVNFSGEEKGLLGSSYYSRHPIVPWEKTVADINMDGVASFDQAHASNRNYIYSLGTEDLSRQLLDITKQVNERYKTSLTLVEGQRFNSDQYNFEAQLIPYIYFSTGLTEHYHQVSDAPETIDYTHFAKVVQLIFATAWQVANKDSRPPSVSRNQLALVGYTCPSCPFECDDTVYTQPGECPVCGMNLVPKYKTP
jgi:hypothetical protein